MVGRKVGAFVVLAVLACARPADAGWLDFIWEMTGPQMFGLGFECEVGIGPDPDRTCLVPFKSFSTVSFQRGDKPKNHFLVSMGAYYYFSTNDEFSSEGVRGFGFDPMLVLSRSYQDGKVRITAGGGLTLQRYWSPDFEAFGNAGLKIRPLAVDFPLFWKVRGNLSYNIRYFWDGFESTAAVEGTPRIPAVFKKGNVSETVHGIGFTFAVFP